MSIKSLLLLLLLGAGAVQAGRATPGIQTWQTAQGAGVYYVPAPELPMVDIRIVFDAGSSRDGDLAGLARLTNGLLNQGAGGLDADAISAGFESLGAIYSPDAGIDSASMQLRSLTDEKLLSPALANFKRVLSEPDFPPAALERQRARTLIGIQARRQSPGALAQDAYMAAVYGAHPYARPGIGTEATVEAIKREDIIDFYRRYYVARNAIIVIVGALDRARAEQVAARLAAGLAAGKPAPALPAVAALDAPRERAIPHPAQQTHILIGQPGVRRGDADYFPLYVGNHVLGGGGMTSRLFDEVREQRGLSYSVYSYFSPMRLQGPFIAGLQTKTEQAGEALRVLRDNIRRFIEQGPTEAELARAKRNITGGYPLRIDSNAKILDYVAMIAYYKLPLDYLATFNARVEAVTQGQIRAAFQRRLAPDRFVTVMVGAGPEAGGQDDP